MYACSAWTCWGNATLGSARPDIAAIYGSQFLQSGWQFPVTHCAAETYLFLVNVHVGTYDYWIAYYKGLVVQANASDPRMGLTTPTNQSAVSSPYSLTGWAIDTGAPSGTGVDVVRNVAYPNPGSGALYSSLGYPSYGDARPDVAAIYGSAYAASGFHQTISLAPGTYYQHVLAHSTYSDGWFGDALILYVDIPTNALTIDRTGTGGIAAAGLSCAGGLTTQGLPCGATYTLHSVVTLTPQADPGSTFAGWTGACSGAGACQVTMTGARYVSATFAKIPSSIDTTYYHTDTVGSVRAITDATGAVVVRHDYLPFGEDAASMTGDPMRFAGKLLDPETALHYFEARYYRQTWGRFSQVDPVHVGAAMTDPQQ